MKRIVSLLLAVVMMLGTFSIVATAAEGEYEQTGAESVIHFDVASTGWNNFSKVFCHIWAHDGSGDWPAWQSKKERCTYDESTGIATYDISKTGNEIEPDKLYVVIFSNENGMQTYNLLFGAECIGDTAYCDGTYYENPEDSSKTAQAAFWKNQDETVYGPEMCVTSIGNIVGTCIPSTTSAYEMFVDFLNNKLINAQIYSGKDDQQLLDDTASALGLNGRDVMDAIDDSSAGYIDWNISDSYLSGALPVKPVKPEVRKYKLTVDADAIWGSNADRIYCHIYPKGEDNYFYKVGDKQEACKKNSDGTWSYDLKANNIELEFDVDYKVAFYSVLPTVPSTPVFDIDINYYDYTLTYDIASLSYVWKYMGKESDLMNGSLIPSLPQLPVEPEDYCIYVDLSNEMWNKIVEVELNINDRRIACDRVYGNIWKADFYKNDVSIYENTTYSAYFSYEAEITEYWEDESYTYAIGCDLPKFKFNTTYLGYTMLASGSDKAEWVHKEYPDYLIGDVDLDGRVSIMDATEIQMIKAAIKKAPLNFDIIADLDGDGKASVMDATELQFILAGLR